MVKQEKYFLISSLMILLIGFAYYKINFQHLANNKLLNNTILVMLTSLLIYLSICLMIHDYNYLKQNGTNLVKIYLHILFILVDALFFIIALLSGGWTNLHGNGKGSPPWQN